MREHTNDAAAALLLENARRLMSEGDGSAARAALIECARLGSVEAAEVAAVMLLTGAGGEADPEEGLRWLRFGAERGAPGAALLLGRIESATAAAEVNGVRWLRVAADAGDAEALYLLGLASFHGRGVERDQVAARKLQQEAAERGAVDAQFELSLLMAQGIGGPIDAQGAARWEAKAAEAGHPRACLNRGARLASRKRPDWAKVAYWYARAAAAGNAAAAARLNAMTGREPAAGIRDLPERETTVPEAPQPRKKRALRLLIESVKT